jgi:hypothetical protein
MIFTNRKLREQAGYRMKIKISRVFLFFLMICIFTSCGTIKKENLKKLKSKNFENYTLFYEETIPDKQIKDYDIIVNNMYFYLTTEMGLDFEKPHFNLAVLPIENEVVNFKKRNTNACTDYENIYLIDMFNLSDEIYEKYGEPSEGIANDAFSHELAHLMTHCVIDYKKNNKVRPNEMNSISFSYIDFTATEFKLCNDIADIIKNNYNEEQYKNLKEDGLISLKNASNDRRPAVFLLYLHMNKEYGKITTFLEAEGLEDFIKKVNWDKNDEELYIEWLSGHFDG